MNIPYADFYGSEVKGNDEDVDAVSSATLNKTRTGSLVGGSYHEDPEGSAFQHHGRTFTVQLLRRALSGRSLRHFDEERADEQNDEDHDAQDHKGRKDSL